MRNSVLTDKLEELADSNTYCGYRMAVKSTGGGPQSGDSHERDWRQWTRRTKRETGDRKGHQKRTDW